MNNAFEILFVVTAIMLVAGALLSVAAPSFGIIMPAAPSFPKYPDLNVQGNVSATYPFSETHNVTVGKLDQYYSVFSPLKRVLITSNWFGNSIDIQRYGTIIIIPWWYSEPIAYPNGTSISTLTAQIIVDNYNGTYSNFTVDLGNGQFQCYASFSPLTGYGNMLDSWNTGHGFQLWMYGSSYTPPGWVDQVVAFLTFLGAIVGYVVYFIAYMIAMVGTLLTLLGLSLALADGVVILVIILFIGSLLMFIRGGSNK